MDQCNTHLAEKNVLGWYWVFYKKSTRHGIEPHRVTGPISLTCNFPVRGGGLPLLPLLDRDLVSYSRSHATNLTTAMVVRINAATASTAPNVVTGIRAYARLNQADKYK